MKYLNKFHFLVDAWVSQISLVVDRRYEIPVRERQSWRADILITVPSASPKQFRLWALFLCIIRSGVTVTMASSLVNFFLFNPPQHEGYSIRNDIDIIRLKTSRGNHIAAMYVDRKETVTILFSHGNAEDLNSCYHFMNQLSSLLNVNVMGYDFSGYGGSTGMYPIEFYSLFSIFELERKTKLTLKIHRACNSQDHPAKQTVTRILTAYTSTY
jgi:hypothetical protein